MLWSSPCSREKQDIFAFRAARVNSSSAQVTASVYMSNANFNIPCAVKHRIPNCHAPSREKRFSQLQHARHRSKPQKGTESDTKPSIRMCACYRVAHLSLPSNHGAHKQEWNRG